MRVVHSRVAPKEEKCLEIYEDLKADCSFVERTKMMISIDKQAASLCSEATGVLTKQSEVLKGDKLSPSDQCRYTMRNFMSKITVN